jgi:phospholipid/cholesterol/gamma-HCH transport system substrate-binding protein
MRMTRQIWTQLAILIVIATTALMIMAFGYIRVPKLLGIGYYTVTVQLPESAGLYPRANVTYRGTEVGEVDAVHLTDTGVQADLKLRSDIRIPNDLDAQVHSTSAVGEQYVALLPRTDTDGTLKDGDVIPLDRSSIPPDINTLLDATNTGLEAIPGDNLKTTIDEAYTAFGGLGPEISRLVRGSTRLATDARRNLDHLTNDIDNVAPVLDTQTDTSDSVQALTAHLADITQQLKTNDQALHGVLKNGPGAADAARQLFERLQPTLPVVLANLASLAPVLVTYQASLEQILVLVPQGAAMFQATAVPNQNTNSPYPGGFLSFNLNLNLPPPCTTGYLPAQQRRSPSFVDAPERPDADLYCRVPQDAMFNVRGVRNFPCETRPGKRAPTVKMCESDENYVPLNEGFNWKGDPNATLSGQDIPQEPPGAPPQQRPPLQPPLAVAEYDPSTGSYVGPDGKVYTQADLAQSAPREQTWQNMLIPPGS